MISPGRKLPKTIRVKRIIGTALKGSQTVDLDNQRHFLIEAFDSQKPEWFPEVELQHISEKCLTFQGKVNPTHRFYRLEKDGAWERERQLHQNFSVVVQPAQTKPRKHRRQKKIAKKGGSKKIPETITVEEDSEEPLSSEKEQDDGFVQDSLSKQRKMSRKSERPTEEGPDIQRVVTFYQNTQGHIFVLVDYQEDSAGEKRKSEMLPKQTVFERWPTKLLEYYERAARWV